MPSKYQFYSKGNIILRAQKLIYKMFLHNNDDKMDQIKQDVKIYYYDSIEKHNFLTGLCFSSEG